MRWPCLAQMLHHFWEPWLSDNIILFDYLARIKKIIIYIMQKKYILRINVGKKKGIVILKNGIQYLKKSFFVEPVTYFYPFYILYGCYLYPPTAISYQYQTRTLISPFSNYSLVIFICHSAACAAIIDDCGPFNHNLHIHTIHTIHTISI